MKVLLTLGFLAGSLTAAIAPVQAQTPTFAGKTVNLYVGFGNTGSYDFYGRLLSRHIGRFIPGNPAVVVQNMPGAGSIKLANWMAAVAPKDGTAIGIVSQTVALDEAMASAGVQYKAAEFNWIGRVTSSGEVMITSAASQVRSIQDAMQRQVVVGTTGPGSPSQGYPILLNAAAGTKFKIISGYPSSGDVLLALEKGEVDAASGLLAFIHTAHRDWIDQKKINVILSETVARQHELPDVPAVGELGNSQEDRSLLQLYASTASIGRSFIAPPGVPADRVAQLRAAFDATMKDEAFLSEVEKTKAEFAALDGAELQKIVAATAQTPAAVISRIKALMQSDEK